LINNTLQILCIGAGRMARAIIAGIVRKQDPRIGKIIVSNRSDREKLADFQKTLGVDITDNWQSEVASSDVILLAIPPSAHKSVLSELSGWIERQFVISVAAGIGIDAIEKHFPNKNPVAWVMPNTAADVGESMSIYACGQYVEQQHKDILSILLSSIGDFEEVKEEQVHELTAITGSAPAIVYQIADILERSAVGYGISQQQARKLVAQMLFGSACMLQQGGDPIDLANQVTSPGGATAAGLKVLKEADFEATLQRSIEAINARAKELNQEE
jgi:pyrroline-5-carboxylate reductase